jgi:hypothetical protein
MEAVTTRNSLFTLLARCAAGTLVLPLALVSGLLTFPTTCACGAAQPHSHPLYAVAGHDHRDADGHAAAVVVSAESDGAVLAAAGSNAHTESQAVWVTPATLGGSRATRPPVSRECRRSGGVDPSLDPPPPRRLLRASA